MRFNLKLLTRRVSTPSPIPKLQAPVFGEIAVRLVEGVAEAGGLGGFRPPASSVRVYYKSLGYFLRHVFFDFCFLVSVLDLQKISYAYLVRGVEAIGRHLRPSKP